MCRPSSKQTTTVTSDVHLTSAEHTEALRALVRIAQHSEFADDIKQLQEEGQVINKSLLIALRPFIDSDGIIRVGGRLRQAAVRYDHMHPIIMPKSHPLTKLLIRRTHADTLHGSIQLMLNTLRQRYWIIHARALVKRCISDCTVCARQSSKPAQQLMADLPSPRVNPARPFLQSAVDYAGPILTRVSKSRGRKQTMKGYICIFVCLATKAIHLEAVSELSTEAFLAAFRRFIGRRGHVTDIYSDNGTNFVGAARTLRQYNDIARKLMPQLAANSVSWHFSPPSAPPILMG